MRTTKPAFTGFSPASLAEVAGVVASGFRSSGVCGTGVVFAADAAAVGR